MQAVLISSHADESAILTTVLQQAGLTVRLVRNFDHAAANWPPAPADLVLTVITTMDETTEKFFRQFRAQSAVPFVVITDSISEDRIVELMEAGVDLVVCRPYGNRLLLAQLRGLLRRSAGLPFHSLPTLSQAGVTLDPSNRTVSVEKSPPTRLTQLEFRLLYTLITHPGHVHSSENLVEHVWGYNGEGNRELVRGLVQRLRSKVEPTPSSPQYIKTEPGVGYFFNREAKSNG